VVLISMIIIRTMFSYQSVVMVQSGNKPLSVSQWTTCQSAIIVRSWGSVLLTRNWPPKTFVLA